MSVILETVQTHGIAELSYLIGDEKTGHAIRFVQHTSAFALQHVNSLLKT